MCGASGHLHLQFSIVHTHLVLMKSSPRGSFSCNVCIVKYFCAKWGLYYRDDADGAETIVGRTIDVTYTVIFAVAPVAVCFDVRRC